MAVSVNAIKLFLQEVIEESDVGHLANATTIAKNIFGEEVWRESLTNVIGECKRLGLLSRADLDLTGVDVSIAGRDFIKKQ